MTNHEKLARKMVRHFGRVETKDILTFLSECNQQEIEKLAKQAIEHLNNEHKGNNE